MGEGDPAGRELKEIFEVLDEEPLIAPPLLDLAQWAADYYLAPPGECYRLAFPPDGVRASRAMVRLAGDPGLHAGDAIVQLLIDGPLSLSTLTRRLGRDPGARLTRLRKDGVIVVEQEIEQASFTEVRLAWLAEPAADVKGKAQKELIARLRAADAAVPVPDLVRDHPSWRGSLDALVERGIVRITTCLLYTSDAADE